MSLADSRRAVAIQEAQYPTLGIIENMSHYVCPSCAHEADIFGHGGGERMAADLGVPFIGRVPSISPSARAATAACRSMMSEPESPAAKGFMAAAERLAAQISVASYNRPSLPPPPRNDSADRREVNR